MLLRHHGLGPGLETPSDYRRGLLANALGQLGHRPVCRGETVGIPLRRHDRITAIEHRPDDRAGEAIHLVDLYVALIQFQADGGRVSRIKDVVAFE